MIFFYRIKELIQLQIIQYFINGIGIGMGTMEHINTIN